MFWNFDQAWLADPQNQNSYAYARNNPIVYSDPSGNISISQIGLFALGFANAYTSDNIFGLGRNSSSDSYYSSGQNYGDRTALAQGTMEMYIAINAGTIANTGGVVLAGSSAGLSLAGAAAINVGTVGFATHGLGVASAAGYYMSESKGNEGGSKNLNNQSDKKGDADFSTHASKRMQERNISAEQVKNIMDNNESFNYFHDNKWKTGYYDSNNKIFIGQGQDTGKITTVIDNVKQSYVDKLKAIKP